MDRSIQRANGFLILAEKELLAFISAVHRFFGTEQAHKSALDWIEELELWIGRLESQLQIGVGPRWVRVLAWAL